VHTGKKDFDALLYFCLFSDIDDEAQLDRYLEEQNLDIDSISENLTKIFRQKKAEYLLKQGEKFKENYLRQINQDYLQQSDNEIYPISDQNLTMAYRKFRLEENSDSPNDENQLDKLNAVKKAKNSLNIPPPVE